MTSEPTNSDGLWTHPGDKFSLGTIHGELIEITAQYNPKEVARQATAQWHVHPNPSSRGSKIGENFRWLEYGTSEPRTLTVELTFDGYELGVTVAPVIARLEALTVPVNMASHEISERRPQMCVAVWGAEKMRCIVTSVATKQTMFDSRGKPLRAICTVTLKEIDAVAVLKSEQARSRR